MLPSNNNHLPQIVKWVGHLQAVLQVDMVVNLLLVAEPVLPLVAVVSLLLVAEPVLPLVAVVSLLLVVDPVLRSVFYKQTSELIPTIP